MSPTPSFDLVGQSSAKLIPASVTTRQLFYSAPSGKQRVAIADVAELDIAAGRLTVLAGPSGSGKSTLLYLLAGLLQPDYGQVRWGDADLVRLGESARDRWRLDHAGFIFQSFNLVEEMSPLENVLTPARFQRLSAGALTARARALLDELGVPTDRKRTALLSRGQQQRVAIARALLLDPPIIFADEPTASLDAESGLAVAGLLQRQARGQGRTVIVATHDAAILTLADRIVHLDHGRIKAPAEAVLQP